jgi:hypothetical protein
MQANQPPTIIPENIYIASELHKKLASWTDAELEYQADKNPFLTRENVLSMVKDLFLNCIHPAGRA